MTSFRYPHLLLIGLLSACATTVQDVPLPNLDNRVDDPSKGRIYVMRPSSFGGAIATDIHVEGRGRIGTTGARGFLCWENEPGAVVLHGGDANGARLVVELAAGDVAWVHQEMYPPSSSLEQIDEQEGRKELQACEAPGLDRARSGSQ